MRPVRGVILAVAPILLLAACGGAASPSASAPAPSAAASATPSEPAASAAPSAGSTVCARSSDPGVVAVTIAGFAYDPDPVTAKVGQVITWTNRDGAPHTASLDGGACATTSLGKDASDGLVFTEAGQYTYFCSIHGRDSMAGRITIEP